MGMIIQHNIPAITALNANSVNISGIKSSQEKLSTGFRINRAADDAAGLAVSEKMRSQIRGLKQATRNSQDGISYIQTAEGALGSIEDILQRARELAEQSATGSYDNETDRAALELEFNQIRDEVDLIAQTDFNGKFVFDTTGATPPDAFGNWAASQTGAANQSADAAGLVLMADNDEGKLTTVTVRYDAITGISAGNARGFSTAALNAFGNDLKTTYIPKVLGGIVNAFPSTAIPSTDGMTIGFKYYYEDNNTLAYVRNSHSYYSTNNAASQTLNLSINLKFLTQSGGSINMTDDMYTTIAHEMMHAYMDDVVTAGMLGQGVDQFPGWFKEGMAQAVGGAMNYVSEILPYRFDRNDVGADLDYVLGRLGVSQPTDADISTYLHRITTNSRDTMMPYEQGYLATMYLGWLVGGGGADAATPVSTSVIQSGLNKLLSDIAGGKSLQQVIRENSSYTSLANFQNNFGDNASVAFVKKLIEVSGAYNSVTAIEDGGRIRYGASGMSANSGTGSVISPNGLSGTKASLMNGTTTSNYFVLYLNGEYGNNFVDLGVPGTSIYEGGGATQAGSQSTHYDPNATTPNTPDPPTPPNPPDPPGPVTPDPPNPPDPPGPNPPGPNTPDPPGPDKPTTPDEPTEGGESVAALKGFETLTLQVGSRAKDGVRFTFAYKCDSLGDLNCDLCCTAQGLGLDKITIANQKSANAAIDEIDHAINKISMMRATFGSVQNRLEYKIEDLTTTSTNLTDAESRIRDTDMAKEIMNLTKSQILQQASQSMLAQANTMPQSILSLLG